MIQTLSTKKVQAIVLAAIVAALMAVAMSFGVQKAYAEIEPGVYVVPAGSNAVAVSDITSTDKKLEIPAKCTIDGKTFKVTVVKTGAFKGAAAKTVTLPKTIKKIEKKAFAKSKVKTLILKTKKLNKKAVKGSLKGSSVKKVKVPASKLKAYKKIFTKKNCGKKVKVVKA